MTRELLSLISGAKGKTKTGKVRGLRTLGKSNQRWKDECGVQAETAEGKRPFFNQMPGCQCVYPFNFY